MRQAITIDFLDGKFAISCPFWANELVKNLPSRRWSKAKRVWQVPLLRLTVEALRRLVGTEGVNATDAAQAALAGYESPAQRVVEGAGFPSWFPFKTKPRKHQLAVLNKKWGKNAFALHHDMGTGKTFTEICYGAALRMEGKIDGMLVLVKLSGRRNWAEQFEAHCPIPFDVYLPYTDDRRGYTRWLATPHDYKVLVVGIESLSQGRMGEMVLQFLSQTGRVFAVIDEAHMVSNHKAERTQKVLDFRKYCDYRDTATGTPISTGPLNLFAQFEWLDPDIIGIGDFYAFRNRYAVIIEQKTKAGKKYPMLVGYRNIDELTKTIAPYTDEVRKEDVLELPPKNYLPHAYVQLTKEQADLYKQVKDEGAYMLKQASEEQVVKNVLELGLRLHQIAQGFMPTYTETPYLGRAGDDRLRRVATWHPIVPIKRNPKIVELVDIAAADRRFIIWCSYRAAIEAIVEALADAYPKERVVQIHGGVSEGDRAAFRAQYQKGGTKFMVGNTATGGQSDTWTACETMVYFDNTEKMIDRAQSEDRAHRDGLTHVVDYIDLVMEKTVDVTRIKSIEQKLDLSEYVRRNIRQAAALLDGGSGA